MNKLSKLAPTVILTFFNFGVLKQSVFLEKASTERGRVRKNDMQQRS